MTFTKLFAILSMTLVLSACADTLSVDDNPKHSVSKIPEPSVLIGQGNGQIPEVLRRPLVFGHRGVAWNHPGNPYPENTVLSIKAAFAAGADGVEVDILKTADDVIVLTHENFLAYEQDGIPKSDCKLTVTKSKWEDIKHCNMQSSVPDGYRTPIDRLEWLFDLPGEGLIALDVKNDLLGIDAENTVSVILDLISSRALEDRVLVLLYEPETMKQFADSGARICLKRHSMHDLSERAMAELADESGGWCLCIKGSLLNDAFVEEASYLGLEILAYINGASIPNKAFDAYWRNFMKWQLWGVMTDRLDRSLLIVDNR